MIDVINEISNDRSKFLPTELILLISLSFIILFDLFLPNDKKEYHII